MGWFSDTFNSHDLFGENSIFHQIAKPVAAAVTVAVPGVGAAIGGALLGIDAAQANADKKAHAEEQAKQQAAALAAYNAQQAQLAAGAQIPSSQLLANPNSNTIMYVIGVVVLGIILFGKKLFK